MQTGEWVGIIVAAVVAISTAFFSLRRLQVESSLNARTVKLETNNEELLRANEKLTADHRRCETNIVSLRDEMRGTVEAAEKRMIAAMDTAEHHRRRAHDVNNLVTPLFFRLIQAGVSAEEVEQLQATFADAMKRTRATTTPEGQ